MKIYNKFTFVDFECFVFFFIQFSFWIPFETLSKKNLYILQWNICPTFTIIVLTIKFVHFLLGFNFIVEINTNLNNLIDSNLFNVHFLPIYFRGYFCSVVRILNAVHFISFINNIGITVQIYIIYILFSIHILYTHNEFPSILHLLLYAPTCWQLQDNYENNNFNEWLSE